METTWRVGRGGFRGRAKLPNRAFTQEDPIGIAGGLNLYGYANGDPVNFSDPFGLKADNGDPCEAFAADEEKYAECERGAKPFKEIGKQTTEHFGEKCVGAFAVAVASSALDVSGGRALVGGTIGMGRLTGELVGDAVRGFLGQPLTGVSTSSTRAVADGVLAGNLGLVSSTVLVGETAALGGGISGWDFVPVVGSLRSWRNVAECSR